MERAPTIAKHLYLPPPPYKNGAPCLAPQKNWVVLIFLDLFPLSPRPDGLLPHDHGKITIALIEANDAEREKRRVAMGEPYRTLLGHFRHEIGHHLECAPDGGQGRTPRGGLLNRQISPRN